MIKFALYAVVFVALVLGGVGCKRQASAAPGSSGQSNAAPRTMKIAVFRDGRVTHDGHAVTLEELDATLRGFAASGGRVWYYREDGRSEPHPHAEQVIRMIVKHRLPLSLSSKPDYTDVLDSDGVPQPRAGGTEWVYQTKVAP